MSKLKFNDPLKKNQVAFIIWPLNLKWRCYWVIQANNVYFSNPKWLGNGSTLVLTLVVKSSHNIARIMCSIFGNFIQIDNFFLLDKLLSMYSVCKILLHPKHKSKYQIQIPNTNINNKHHHQIQIPDTNTDYKWQILDIKTKHKYWLQIPNMNTKLKKKNYYNLQIPNKISKYKYQIQILNPNTDYKL